MNFELSEEQQMLKTSARDFLEAESPESYVREIEKGDEGYSSASWKKIADLGWLGMPFPEEYEGTESSLLDMAILYGEMGRALFPSPHMSTVILCGLAILGLGTDEQKKEFLPKIADGKTILSLALTEPSATWEPTGIQVTAKADGDNFIINGTKLFVHDANIADYLLVVTRTKETANPEDGVTLFLVDAKSPGVNQELLYVTPGNKQSEVTFNNVKVPKKNMLGELDHAWAPVEEVMKKGAVLLCAQMTGASRKLLEISVDYAKTRIQFDAPIGVHQWLQEHCIHLYAYMKSSEDITFKAAWALDTNNPEADLAVARAKAWVSDCHEKACWHCHQAFGGVGGQMDAGIQPLASRRGKGLELYLGDGKHWRKKIAKVMDSWTLEKTTGAPVGLWDRREPQC